MLQAETELRDDSRLSEVLISWDEYLSSPLLPSLTSFSALCVLFPGETSNIISAALTVQRHRCQLFIIVHLCAVIRRLALWSHFTVLHVSSLRQKLSLETPHLPFFYFTFSKDTQPSLTIHALCVQAHAGKPWPTWRSSRTTRSRLGSASSTWKNTPTTSTSHGPNAPAWWTARSCASASTRPSWGPAGRKWDSTSVWGEWVGFFCLLFFFPVRKQGLTITLFGHVFDFVLHILNELLFLFLCFPVTSNA